MVFALPLLLSLLFPRPSLRATRIHYSSVPVARLYFRFACFFFLLSRRIHYYSLVFRFGVSVLITQCTLHSHRTATESLNWLQHSSLPFSCMPRRIFWTPKIASYLPFPLAFTFMHRTIPECDSQKYHFNEINIRQSNEKVKACEEILWKKNCQTNRQHSNQMWSGAKAIGLVHSTNEFEGNWMSDVTYKWPEPLNWVRALPQRICRPTELVRANAALSIVSKCRFIQCIQCRL